MLRGLVLMNAVVFRAFQHLFAVEGLDVLDYPVPHLLAFRRVLRGREKFKLHAQTFSRIVRNHRPDFADVPDDWDTAFLAGKCGTRWNTSPLARENLASRIGGTGGNDPEVES